MELVGARVQLIYMSLISIWVPARLHANYILLLVLNAGSNGFYEKEYLIYHDQ